jgi:hypothetical protein
MKQFDYSKYVTEKTLLKEDDNFSMENVEPQTEAQSSGLHNLTPDEQTQLKEYINSMKEIKKEIKSLLEKARGASHQSGMTTEKKIRSGKSSGKSSNWGGPRKNMILDPNKPATPPRVTPK